MPNATKVSRRKQDAWFSVIAVQGWGLSAELGGAVVFLASNGASFITVQNIAVNGGMTVG
jgi:hypothetical protein